MIVFILCLLAGSILLAYVILSSIKKKHFHMPFTPLMGMLGAILVVAPTFSVTYHTANESKAYQDILATRQNLKDALAASSNEEEKEVAIAAIDSYNKNVRHNISLASSQWVSAFTYSFYYQKGEALVITVK